MQIRTAIAALVGFIGLSASANALSIDEVDHSIRESIQEPNISIPEPQELRIVYLNEKDSIWDFDSLDKEIECLAKNIYFEGWQEPEEGKKAIALVTINRVKSVMYPNSICDVVWQKNKHYKTKRWTAQFSWTLDGKPDVPKNQTAWEECLELASEMLRNQSLDNIFDFTEGATNYHAVYVKPRWRKAMNKVAQYGLHVFYHDPKALVALN